MSELGLTTGAFDPESIGARRLAFTEAEYAERRARLRRLLAAAGIDLLYATTPEVVCYLHGLALGWYKANSPMRYPQVYGTAVHRGRGDIVHFDNPTERPIMAAQSVCRDVRYFTSRELAPNLRFVMDELERDGLIPGRVGLEMWSYLPNRVVGQEIERAFRERGCEVVDASLLTRELRRVKSAAEIALIEEGVRLADIGHAAIGAYARPGMTELALFGEVLRAMMAEGSELAGLIPIFTAVPVANGRLGIYGHGLPGERRLAAGEALVADLCGVVRRYHGNVLRAHVLGTPPAGLIARHERAAGVYDVIERELKAGMTVAEVNRRLKAYYAEVGLLEEPGWALGYELGLSFPPDWVGEFYFNIHDEAYLERVFEPGMVTNFESLFNTALIDTLVWQADGVRVLSRTPRTILAAG